MLPLKLRAIFFDLGGTLLKPRRDRIVQNILESEGIYIPLHLIQDAHHAANAWWQEFYGGRVLSGQEEEKAFKELNLFVLEKIGLTTDRVLSEHLVTLVVKHWSEAEKRIQPELYPDVQPYLQKLKSRGYILGLISNAAPKDEEIVSRVGLNRYMDHIVISGIIGVAKPDEGIFRHALSLASVSSDECLHVGDSYKADVLGARRAGIRAVLIDRDDRHPEADCPRIRSLDELDRFLVD